MNEFIELPLVPPVYSTYHLQGSGSAIIVDNPSIRNWYLNQVMLLTCSRKFLKGYTTPEIDIAHSSWYDNPHLERRWYCMQFLNGHVNEIIRRLLDAGYYVRFKGVDDYYIKGKSWYKERHFNHDGIICGYNQNDKTYCIYAYDSNWIYQKFWTPQRAFDAGRKAMLKHDTSGYICGIKAKDEIVEFSADIALKHIADYLNSNMREYPINGSGYVEGIVVHNYIAKYLQKLYDGSISYERMDRRVFRLIWEHKKVMLERIVCIEKALNMDSSISEKYKPLVTEADTMRILYASYHMRRKDSILTAIQKKLLMLKAKEQRLLNELLKKSEGEKK